MARKILKPLSINILLIFILYLLLSVIAVAIFSPSVSAVSLEKNDIYTGIGLALLLMIISEIGQSSDGVDIEEDIQVENDNITFAYAEEDDLDLLARLIHAEAKGEPYRGQVAVGAVVLNRVKSVDFPDNIENVIFQPGQFTVVDNGQINLDAGTQAYRAAEAALDGQDPSKGALYFYNPETARTLWWLSTRPKTVQIGNHVFAR